MGYVLHHAIVVHSFDGELTEAAHGKAIELGMRPSAVQPPGLNGYVGFYVPPDGSKEGWAESRNGDAARNSFVAWLVAQAHDDGSNNLDWVEVAFGGDEPDENTEIVRAKGYLERACQSLRTVRKCRELVREFFDGNEEKVELWFTTPNPMLGNVIPNDLIAMGREEKLPAFIQTALAENER